MLRAVATKTLDSAATVPHFRGLGCKKWREFSYQGGMNLGASWWLCLLPIEFYFLGSFAEIRLAPFLGTNGANDGVRSWGECLL